MDVKHRAKRGRTAPTPADIRRRLEAEARQAVWDELMRRVLDDGVFTTVDVARLTGRRTATVRRWIFMGWVPPGRPEGVDQPHARHLYTRRELLEVVRGIRAHVRPVPAEALLAKVEAYLTTLFDAAPPARSSF